MLPPRPDLALTDVCTGSVKPKERAGGDVDEELGAILDHGVSEGIKDLHRHTDRIRIGLDHARRDGRHQHGLRDPAGAMSTEESSHLAAAGGMADHDGVLEIELFENLVQVVRVRVHVVAVPGLGRTPVAAPVVGDDAIAFAGEEEHLVFPVVRAQRPSVAEHDGLGGLGSPVFVVDLGAIFRRDVGHFLLGNYVGVRYSRARESRRGLTKEIPSQLRVRRSPSQHIYRYLSRILGTRWQTHGSG